MRTVHAVFSGIVQGVGFRAHFYRTALRYGIKGWVRNIEDGSVEAMLQGSEDKVKGCIDEIRSNPGRAVISEVRVETVDMEEYTDFMVVP